MSNTRCSSYKGYSITARWAEAESEIGILFSASYTVDRPGAHSSLRQQFEASVFDTPEHAILNALASAKRSIDLDEETATLRL